MSGNVEVPYTYWPKTELKSKCWEETQRYTLMRGENGLIQGIGVRVVTTRVWAGGERERKESCLLSVCTRCNSSNSGARRPRKSWWS